MRLRLITFALLLLFSRTLSYAQENDKKISSFRDSLDKALDLSDWLINKKGILLVPSLITEPAVGYGATLAGVFFHSSYTEKNGPPSMTGVFGALTQNGTWGAGVFHVGYWKQDRIRYMGAVARLYANLGFYGSGNNELPGDGSVNLNLDSWLLLQQIKFRLGNTNLFLGGRYLLFNTINTFEVPLDLPEFSGNEFSSTLSEVSLKFELDTRNNVFTPTKGLLLGLTGTYSDTWMGGDALYGRINSTLIGYIPAGKKVLLGVRHESTYSLGAVPFYARPIIFMRGAPVMKYQNKNIMVMEAEIDWNIFRRWCLTGFTGMGNAFESFSKLKEGKSVSTVGTGFRYLIVRKLGMNMGMDFAMSQDDFAFYIVFGTAWLR